MSTGNLVHNLSAGTIQICDSYVPALVEGSYTISVASKVTNSGGSPSYYSGTASQNFTVEGASGLFIEQKQIYSFSPIDQSTGQYDTTLPHIIFKNPHYPWERSNVDDPKTPWVFLMSFNSAELGNFNEIGKSNNPKTLTGSYTFNTTDLQGSNLPSYFNIYTADDLKASSTVNLISVNLDLFKSFFSTNNSAGPSSVIQSYTHCRNINTGTALVDGLSENGFYAVSLANRFPTVPSKTFVHLVSLEPLIKKGYFNPNSPFSGLGSQVYLISLKSWTINCQSDPAENFTQYMKKISIGTLSLYPPRDGSIPKIYNTKMATAGYIPVKYHLPTGINTVTWYRGPLVPDLPTTRGPKRPSFINSPGDSPITATNSLQLIMYDTQSQITNVTYATAWELGKSLALADKTFTTNVLSLKKRIKIQASKTQRAAVFGKTNLVNSLEQIVNQVTEMTASATQSDYKGYFTDQSVVPTSAANIDSRIPTHFEALKGDQKTKADVVLTKIVAWLTELTLLSNIPFHYMVPNPAMVPMESLRFFFIDAYWIEALVDGALSLGTHFSTDQIINTLIKTYLTEYQTQNGIKPLLGGYLLRSGAVTAHPALCGQFGYDAGSYQPQVSDDQSGIYKTQRLSDDLVAGWFTTTQYRYLIFKEPSEQLRMGFGGETWSERTLSLRSIDNNNSINILKTYQTSDMNSFTSSNGIIDTDAITASAKVSINGSMTPAYYGLQLTAVPKALAVSRTVWSS